MRISLVLGLAAGSLAVGCAASLKQPVRVRAPVAYLMKQDRTFERDRAVGGGKECVQEVTTQVVYLPGGESYELDFERGFMASNAFSVQLHESGTLKQVSLNSDPQVDETITAVGGLIEKVAGAAAKVAPLMAGAAVVPGPVCTPSVSVKFAPLVCFLDPQPPVEPGVCPPNPAAW